MIDLNDITKLGIETFLLFVEIKTFLVLDWMTYFSTLNTSLRSRDWS